jgi:hypothetical protein
MTAPPLEPWFADLLGLQKIDSFSNVAQILFGRLEVAKWASPCDTVIAAVDWRGFDVEQPTSKWWESAHIDDFNVLTHAATKVLVATQHAMRVDKRMPELVANWSANRARGAQADSEKIPLIARESGRYASTMTLTTDDEKAAMAAYDAAIDAFIARSEMPPWVGIAVLSSIYVMGMQGFESRFVFATMRDLRALGDDAARRAMIDMVSHFQFETPAIEQMTHESIAAVAPAPAAQ